jgi:hypothetical protein
MKRIALIAAAVFLMASFDYADCVKPISRHIDYYQFHTNNYVPGGPFFSYWSLDGTSDRDCSGNTYYSGDTHIDDETRLVVTTADCDQVCDPPPM